jgi:acyl-CoA thioesterase
MKHPFAELIALEVVEQAEGRSRCELEVTPDHLNPHGVVHGAVLFALADTGMGAALYPTLGSGESCATIEIKINFFRPAKTGRLRCDTTVVNRGRTVANLESRVTLEGVLLAVANGNYAVFPRREGEATALRSPHGPRG